MKVCVVGAGIVGCSTAYQLARSGFEVHMVDSANGPGMGASLANGAQLSYSYVEPLASPHTLASLPGLLFSRNSPLRFTPQPDWRQWAWGLRFLAACTQRRARAGTQALLHLSALSRKTLDEWIASEKWDVDFDRNGKLVLCPDQASMDRQRQQIAFQAELGCDQTLLRAEECVAREPALQSYLPNFVGGVWTPDERVADPHKLCWALTRSLVEHGGVTSFGTHVQGAVIREKQVAALKTTQGDIEADAFVIATGPSAARHGAIFGLYLPVYPIKGYSITVPIRDARKAPNVSVTDLSRKTVFAPLGGRLRVAAMAEVAGYSTHVPPDRVQRMLDSVSATFPGACHLVQPTSWAGLRPATPDAVPIVGQRKYSNLFFNVGHGALGLTLAAGSAAALVEEMKRVLDSP